MATTTDTSGLVEYLSDAYSIEQQALQQLRTAPAIASEEGLARILEHHLVETEGHERLVRERLEAYGESPSRLKDVVMRAGGVGFVLFAAAQPDTPGKLAAHAYSYEHLESAAYKLLTHVAGRAGDRETEAVAERIRGEEDAMGRRLAESFDAAVDASLDAVPRSDLGGRLDTYLADAHALEAQAAELLAKGPKIAGEPELARIYAEHLEETRGHQRLVEARLDARDATPSLIKDAGLRLGALNWGLFFAAQKDTPAKLAAFTYAFEHLEIAGYEQLRRVAERASDEESVAMTQTILSEERAAATRIAGAFERAANASLDALG